MISVDDINKAKIDDDYLKKLYGKLTKVINAFDDKYGFVFSDKSKEESFLMGALKESLNDYDYVRNDFESFFKTFINRKIVDRIRLNIDNKDYKFIDRYIINLYNKYGNDIRLIYYLCQFIDEINDVDLIVFCAKNNIIKNVLVAYIKGDEINLKDIPKKWQTTTTLLLINFYCDMNNINYVNQEIEEIDDKLDSSERRYLNEISKIPLLTPEETKELIIKIKQGDETARKKIIESNLRFVVYLAKKYINRGIPFLDLVQEGNIGLMKAIDKFDPSKGLKLSTYSSFWIKEQINRLILNTSRNIRIPIHKQENYGKYIRLNNKLSNELGRNPTFEELAYEMGCSVEEVKEYNNIIKDTVSLNTLVGEDNDTELENFIAYEDESINNFVNKEFLKKIINFSKSKLSLREVYILELRYGLYDGTCWSLNKVATEFGITFQRVKQIEGKALKKLRQILITNEEFSEHFRIVQENDNKKVTGKKLDFYDRVILFLNTKDMSKYENNKIKFPDGISMCSWFYFNIDKINNDDNQFCRLIKREYEYYKFISDTSCDNLKDGNSKINKRYQ